MYVLSVVTTLVGINHWASHKVSTLARILGYWATDRVLYRGLLPRVHVLLPVRIAKLYRYGGNIYYITSHYILHL